MKQHENDNENISVMSIMSSWDCLDRHQLLDHHSTIWQYEWPQMKSQLYRFSCVTSPVLHTLYWAGATGRYFTGAFHRPVPIQPQ